VSTRRIAVVTTSRADYGHLIGPLRELRARPEVELRLIALGAHLSPAYGETVREIERDGFRVAERIECLLSSDTDVGMAKTIGLATLSLADALARERPDLLLLIADRYEMLAPASVALALRIPIAHIEGGELSEGAIDQAVRNALTMVSHIHLVPTETARRRVIAMGEEEWRVHRVGAPSLDHLRTGEIPGLPEVERRLGVTLPAGYLVVSFHPVTLDRDTAEEAEPFFRALARVSRPLVLCFPNADAGNHRIAARARELCAVRRDAQLFVNLPHLDYWALLRGAAAIVGNSSSGIMEAPSIPLPTVNIGRRQQGRERARSVIDAPAEEEQILAAITRAVDPSFRLGLVGLESPYGDGRAGERIAEILATVELGARLLEKRGLVV
jgi:UDP-hydrolysing UDP-N-acetyl-D-glucosamine 2-epimerase